MIQQVTPEDLHEAVAVFEPYADYLGGLDLDHLYAQMLPMIQSGQVVMFVHGRSVAAAMVFVSPYLPEITAQVVAWRAEKPLVAAALMRRVIRWAKACNAARLIVLAPPRSLPDTWNVRETYHELPLAGSAERKVA